MSLSDKPDQGGKSVTVSSVSKMKNVQINFLQINAASSRKCSVAVEGRILLTGAFGKGGIIKLLFDTGAAASVITPKDFRNAVKQGAVIKRLEGEDISLSDAGGNDLGASDVYLIKLRVADREIEVPFVLAKHLRKHSILGLNAILHFGLTLDTATRTIYFARGRDDTPISICAVVEDGSYDIQKPFPSGWKRTAWQKYQN